MRPVTKLFNDSKDDVLNNIESQAHAIARLINRLQEQIKKYEEIENG
jgi:hypothetical protein